MYISKYTNEYGEEWIFEYNYLNKTAIIKGSDIDWQSYIVTNGYPDGLILNAGEREWLKTAWQNAMEKYLDN